MLARKAKLIPLYNATDISEDISVDLNTAAWTDKSGSEANDISVNLHNAAGSVCVGEVFPRARRHRNQEGGDGTTTFQNLPTFLNDVNASSLIDAATTTAAGLMFSAFNRYRYGWRRKQSDIHQLWLKKIYLFLFPVELDCRRPDHVAVARHLGQQVV